MVGGQTNLKIGSKFSAAGSARALRRRRPRRWRPGRIRCRFVWLHRAPSPARSSCARPAIRAGMGEVVPGISLLAAAGVVSRQESPAVNRTRCEQRCQKVTALSDSQHDGLLVVAEPIVSGPIGPDLVLGDLCCAHKKPSGWRVDASRLFAPSWSHIRFRDPPCPGGQVGMGVDPIPNVN